MQANNYPNFYQNANVLQRDNITSLQYPYNNYGFAMQQPQNLYLKCRPVSSKDEAKVAQIDLDGSLWVFPDIGNQKIYTKQINADGTAKFNTYILTEEKDNNDQQKTDYVTKEEFNETIQKILSAISIKQDSSKKMNF